MLGAGPPRDGIIRTSPGQECSKDKGALPGARRIFVYAARSWSAAGHAPSVWFRSWLLILHPGDERVSLYPAKRQAPVAQWIEHLITVQKVGGSSPSGRAAAPLGAIHRWGFCISTKHSFGSAFFMPISRLSRSQQVGSRLSRDKVRPTLPPQWYFREKIRPARQKTLILGCFERAGRVFSRSGVHPCRAGRILSRSGATEAIAMKPVAPLRGGVGG